MGDCLFYLDEVASVGDGRAPDDSGWGREEARRENQETAGVAPTLRGAGASSEGPEPTPRGRVTQDVHL